MKIASRRLSASVAMTVSGIMGRKTPTLSPARTPCATSMRAARSTALRQLPFVSVRSDPSSPSQTTASPPGSAAARGSIAAAAWLNAPPPHHVAHSGPRERSTVPVGRTCQSSSRSSTAADQNHAGSSTALAWSASRSARLSRGAGRPAASRRGAPASAARRRRARPGRRSVCGRPSSGEHNAAGGWAGTLASMNVLRCNPVSEGSKRSQGCDGGVFCNEGTASNRVRGSRDTAMKPVTVQVITYAPTIFLHCQHCEVAFQEMGLGERLRRQEAAESLPDDLALDFQVLSDWVHSVLQRYGGRVRFRSSTRCPSRRRSPRSAIASRAIRRSSSTARRAVRRLLGARSGDRARVAMADRP